MLWLAVPCSRPSASRPSACSLPCLACLPACLSRCDPQAALDAGLQFGLSSNGVLLCEGPVPVALVKRVELDELPEEWRQGRGQQGQGQQEQGAEKKQRQGKGKAQQGQPPEQKDEGKERREQEAAVGGDKDTEGVKQDV